MFVRDGAGAVAVNAHHSGGVNMAIEHSEKKNCRCPDCLWKDDSIQFARLLSEISACGLRESQYIDIAQSMDLTVGQVDELLGRADAAWDRHLKDMGLR